MRRPEQQLQRLVEQFAACLCANGLHGAMGFLNARTRHRFTGVFRFEPPMLRSVALFDRENPRLRVADDRPLHDSYCAFVAASGMPFEIDDSSFDLRLTLHSLRDTVCAYHAVPLYRDGNALFGSLCHWDVRPRLVPTTELPLLIAVAPLVMKTMDADAFGTVSAVGAASHQSTSPADSPS